MVDIRRLIDDVNLQQLGSEQELNDKSVQLQQELSQERDKSFQNQEVIRQQRKKLHSAFISAFPEQSLLEQLLYYDLDKNLNEITQESNLNTIIFKLIQTAESQGWLLDLVRVAYESNPGNSELKAIAQEL
jgi:internalin A